MKLNDPDRFARELQGDFSEIDAYLRGQKIKMVVFAIGLVICYVLIFAL